jgi:hypothetical protein
MSINPGATTRFAASMVCAAWRPASCPISTIRSPVMPTSARNHGAPVPSTTRPPVINTSNVVAGEAGDAGAAGEAGC